MKIPNKIKTLGSIVALAALTGCNPQNKEQTYNPPTIVIHGKPVSTSFTPETRYEYSTLNAVLDMDNGYVLAHAIKPRTYYASQASALIQSEINDGDNETVELTGKYIDKKFEIESLIANGIEIYLK